MALEETTIVRQLATCENERKIDTNEPAANEIFPVCDNGSFELCRLQPAGARLAGVSRTDGAGEFAGHECAGEMERLGKRCLENGAPWVWLVFAGAGQRTSLSHDRCAS